MTHPLKTYLDKHQVTETEFAQRVSDSGEKTTASYISQIIIGYRKPGSALAIAIADATNKSVSVDDLLRFEVTRRRHKRTA